MGDWNQSVYDYMVADESCCAAGMAARADGALYAVADTSGGNTDSAWGYMFADPQNRKQMQEDGSEADVWIDESAELAKAVNDADAGKMSKFYLGGQKYAMVRIEDNFEDSGLKMIRANVIGGKGANICFTASTIVVGCWDQNTQTAGQASNGYCATASAAMGKYMRDDCGQ